MVSYELISFTAQQTGVLPRETTSNIYEKITENTLSKGGQFTKLHTLSSILIYVLCMVRVISIFFDLSWRPIFKNNINDYVTKTNDSIKPSCFPSNFSSFPEKSLFKIKSGSLHKEIFSHNKVWSYKDKKTNDRKSKDETCLLTTDFKPFRSIIIQLWVKANQCPDK